MSYLKRFLIELLFPSSCSACGIDTAYQLCHQCTTQLLSSQCVKCESVQNGFCKQCASELGISGFRVFAPYSLIKQWVYCHKLDLSSKVDLMEDESLDLFFTSLEKIIEQPFSVELVPTEDKENWVENILPNSIKNRIGPPVLRRVENQVGQKYLNREERNIRGGSLFEISSNVQLTTDTVLLIDDVMTTGISLQSCVSMLLGLGYKRVYVVVFAYKNRLT